MTRIDLNSKPHPDCATKCNKALRQSITENDLCILLNSVEDGLPVRCVGQWAEQKIYLLYQYFGIFSEGMKHKWEMNYIEICSGPGRCISRTYGDEIDGTALCVLKHKAFKNINKALFFDFNDTVVNVLNQRIEQIGAGNAKAFIADYNKVDELCCKIISEIKPESLNLVLIDPKKIGFNHFDIESVNHYYDILFAAGHEKAIEFWNKATAIKYNGQRSLF